MLIYLRVINNNLAQAHAYDNCNGYIYVAHIVECDSASLCIGKLCHQCILNCTLKEKTTYCVEAHFENKVSPWTT